MTKVHDVSYLKPCQYIIHLRDVQMVDNVLLTGLLLPAYLTLAC
jgi:hypothetical protein